MSQGTLTTANSVCGVLTTGSTWGTAGTSACTVGGEVIFSQNGIKDFFCNQNAGLTINLQGTGLSQDRKYTVYVAADCALTAAAYKVVEFTAPIVGPQGVNLYYCADGFNVDGSNGKRSVDGLYTVVQDTTSLATTVSCTSAVLA